MRSIATLGLVGLTLAVLLAGSPAAALEPAEWNQEAVAESAKQFAEQISALKLDVRAEQLEKEDNVMLRHSSYVISEDMKLIDRRARLLSKRLAEGDDKDATAPIFRRLVSHIRDIQADARSWPGLQDLGPQIATARTALEQLAAFYGVDLPAPMVPKQLPSVTAPKN